MIGSGKKRVLLDTGDMGESNVAYMKLLRKLLNDQNCEIDKIIISHWHHDHLNGGKRKKKYKFYNIINIYDNEVNGIQAEFGPNIPVYKNMEEEEASKLITIAL